MLPTKRILLLDDDLEVHHFVSDLLQLITEHTCELVSFEEYDLAMVQLHKEPFDLCLVDYIFHDSKDRTGMDFIRDAVLHHPQVPCILFTGNGDIVAELRGIQVGAVDYIDKGDMSPQSFVRTVRYALKRSSTNKELYSLYQQTLFTSQFRSEMMRLASHDIKNPLSTIMLSVDMLMRRIDFMADPFLQKHMQRIRSATDRIELIADEILTMEALNMERDFEETDITLLTQSVIREMGIQGQLQSKNLVFAPVPNLPFVYAIPGQIREVLFNLVLNAIKYTSADGNIEIWTRVKDNVVEVSIIDDGCGIATHQQDKLFQPFYRVVTEETQHINGSGLGLFLVKQIIERHQGTISFDSVLGEGSTFRFSLPCIG